MRNLITCLSVCVLSGTALADTWTVDDDGKADFNNIQSAIDAASDGDEIIVMPGTYTSTASEVVDMRGKEIWLHSSAGAEVTIIDGEGARLGIRCTDGENSSTIIEGFTITNGWTNSIGGGMLNYSSNPTVTDCTFENNTSTTGGGGMYNNQNSNPTLTSCMFTGNTSYKGGGMFNESTCNPILTSCTLTSNTATNGGGMFNHLNNAPILTNCMICSNTPDQIDGGHTDGGGNYIADECPANDADEDGVTDDIDNCYLYNPDQADCNGNGIGDICDIANQTSFDCDQNGVPDECQPDCDGDGWIDACDNDSDIDGDGIPDNCELDCNENSLPDDFEIAQGIAQDCNGNGIPDECDLVNGGQVPEGAIQWPVEEGGNGHWYQVIATSDGYHPTWNESRVFAQDLGGDMVTFETESELDFCRANLTQPTETTNNGAWIGLYQEPGSSEPAGDWYWTSGLAASMDWGWVSGEPNDNGGEDKALINLSNNNSSTWFLYYDYNGNNDNRNYFIEWDENSFSIDCDGNGAIDSCEMADNPSLDCNGNGTLDSCEDFDDCNYNEIPDSCDISDGTSNDVNMNGVPDECESDCNENGIPDDWEIKNGLALDCNENMLPDECDIADGTSNDVNSNDVPDECEDDCNGNGIPDDWDIKTGAALDCNGNGIPDYCDVAAGCDTDCNLNGVPDSCDLASGTSEDINANNLPDECECIADITDDGTVDIHDILALIGYWDSAGPLGDLNADGVVSIHDLLILVAGWGECTNIICNDDPPIGAVQWPVEVGGNGHWYLGISNVENLEWDAARIAAKEIGGHLVTITTLGENEWVRSNIASDINLWTNHPSGGLDQGPWIGAFNYDNGWMWVDGSGWSYEFWYPGNPGECCPAVVSLWDYYGEKRWQDHPGGEGQYTTKSYIVEWSN